MKAVHGSVVDVRKMRSLQVARILIEVPVESYKAVVDLLDEQQVLVTVSDLGLPFGVVDSVAVTSDDEAQKKEPQLSRCEEPRPEKQPGRRSLAQEMMINGYFRSSRLWGAMEAAGIYTQQMHRERIEKRCQLEKRGGCSGDVVLHHVRTANNSGMGIKPDEWFVVPLCHHHHQWVHQTGEMRGELLKSAVQHTADGMRAAMKNALGLESMAGITHQQVREFEDRIGLNDLAGLTG